MNISKAFLRIKLPSMYYVAIFVLSVVAVVESFGRGLLPVNAVVAVLATSILDIALKKFWLKRPFTIPLSAIITGLIIGTVSVNAPVFGALIAASLAILSKFVIRRKGSHIFNPAVFGVVTIQLLNPAAHGSGSMAHGASQMVMEGFGPGGFAVTLWLVPLLLFANWRANKVWVAIPFLVVSALLYQFTGLATLGSLNVADTIKFLELLPYYFAFIIVSEPKTSPWARNEQIIFGTGIAILSVLPLIIFGFYSHAVSLVTLLLGNLMYAAYRATARG